MSHNDKCSPRVSDSFFILMRKPFIKILRTLLFFAGEGGKKHSQINKKTKGYPMVNDMVFSFMKWNSAKSLAILTMDLVWLFFLISVEGGPSSTMNERSVIRVGGDIRDSGAQAGDVVFRESLTSEPTVFFTTKMALGFWKESCVSQNNRWLINHQKEHDWVLLKC